MLITAAEVERHAEPAAECSTDRTQRLAVILANNPGTPAPASVVFDDPEEVRRRKKREHSDFAHSHYVTRHLLRNVITTSTILCSRCSIWFATPENSFPSLRNAALMKSST